MHIVNVVDVELPGWVKESTCKVANNSILSFGSKSKENISVPSAVSNEGVPPQEVAVQSMDVEDSWALPKFSTIIHAEASYPGRPTPCDVPRPSGPTIESPRVRKTSIGNLLENEIFASLSSVAKMSTNEFSSPNASEGILASKII